MGMRNIIGAAVKPLGIQTITDAQGAQTLTLPTTAVPSGSVIYATFQATVTTWAFSDVTTRSPTTANCQVVNPNLEPWPYTGDLSKVQVWCTTANAKLLVHYYRG